VLHLLKERRIVRVARKVKKHERKVMPTYFPLAMESHKFNYMSRA